MKILISFIICLFVCSSLSSQQKIYSGIIKDFHSNDVIPFATIAIYNDSTLIDGTSTDELGKFALKVLNPHTHVEVSFIGYQIYRLSISEIVTPLDLEIFLQSQANLLEELIVKADKTTTQLKIDRKIINLGTDLQQAGTTALEAFDQIPEIQTDLAVGTISLRGTGNIRLLVNGKPSPLNSTELLSQIPASSVDRIEIITSPSAKNQANGLSGIINIILKKNADKGFNLGLITSIGTKRHQYGFESNYNFNKINIRLNASESRRRMNSEQWISQKYSNGNTRDFYAPHDFRGRVQKIASGIDFFFNDKNELSFQFDFTNDFHRFFNNTYYSNISNFDDYSYLRNSSHTHLTSNYNVNYRKKFTKKGQFLEFDYNLTTNKNILPAEDFNDEIFLFSELQSNKNNLHALALDFVYPLRNVTLETGSSWNYRQLNSSRAFEFNDSSTQNDQFNYHENLLGIYVQTNFKTKKLNWQTGLRYEYFESNSENTVNNKSIALNFSNLFPSIHLSYQYNKLNTLSAGYSKRIARPSFRNINPFQIGNQYFQWNANPNLAPEFSDNFELNYLFINQKISLSSSVFYRYQKDAIQWIESIDSNGVQFVSFDNAGDKNAFGIESNISYSIYKFWNTQLSSNYYYTNTNQENVTWNQLYSSSIQWKNTLKLSKNISTDFTFRHTPINRNIYSITRARNRLDWAVRANLLNNKLNVNLRIVDVLNQNLRHSTMILPNIEQNETWKFQSQTFGWLLSLNYKLFQNNGKTRNRKTRNYSHEGAID